MNIYGLIATIVICVTVITVTALALVIIKRLQIHSKSREYHISVEQVSRSGDQRPTVSTEKSTQVDKKLEEELNKQSVAASSMDAVIKAANELMGIVPQEDTDETRK